eukprot:scaffold4406_cov112-Isochrysis_galbana.AAC.17
MTRKEGRRPWWGLKRIRTSNEMTGVGMPPIKRTDSISGSERRGWGERRVSLGLTMIGRSAGTARVEIAAQSCPERREDGP